MHEKNQANKCSSKSHSHKVSMCIQSHIWTYYASSCMAWIASSKINPFAACRSPVNLYQQVGRDSSWDHTKSPWCGKKLVFGRKTVHHSGFVEGFFGHWLRRYVFHFQSQSEELLIAIKLDLVTKVCCWRWQLLTPCGIYFHSNLVWSSCCCLLYHVSE